jgi:hypothetical protein
MQNGRDTFTINIQKLNHIRSIEDTHACVIIRIGDDNNLDNTSIPFNLITGSSYYKINSRQQVW